MSNAFMVYLPALPHGKFEIERGELPWIYDQDPSSGFVATMRVVPEDDYKKLEAENEQLKTVPMRYRRLAFNAKLQDENDELRNRVEQLEAENSTLRGHIEQLREAVEEGLSTYKVPMTARICEAITALAATEPPIGDSGILDGSNRKD